MFAEFELSLSVNGNNLLLTGGRATSSTPAALMPISASGSSPGSPHHNERQRCDIINLGHGKVGLRFILPAIMRFISCAIRFSLQPDVCQVTTANISTCPGVSPYTQSSDMPHVEHWSPANQRTELICSVQSEVMCRKEVTDRVHQDLDQGQP